MNSLLTDTHAVIYGGGGAIGAGVAAAFAREGAHVHLVGRTAGSLEAAAAEIRSGGGVADVAVLDAGDERAVEAHLAGLPRVDVSLNLVTRGDVQGRPLHELTVDEVMRPLAGVRATFVTARAAARRMRKQRSGVILWLNSGSGGSGGAPGMGGTGPADAATDSYMRLLAAELGGDGVRVCGIYTAGVYDTFMRDGNPDTAVRPHGITATQIDRMMGSHAALGRAPRLAEVADAAVFLASRRASGTTGAVINVTAGIPVR